MIKKILLLLAILFNLNFYAQTDFEKGYIIDNNNVKTECLIKNEGWHNNPEYFYVKSDSLSEIKYKGIYNIKEISIGELYKYKRFEGKIDVSTEDFNKLGETRDPIWENKTLFLKFLIDSQYKLYEYRDGNMVRFFCSKDDSSIEQLVFKKYYFNNDYNENTTFKQQLFTKFKCDFTSIKSINEVEYTLKSLKKYFIEINKCNGNIVVENKVNSKDGLAFKLKAGINNNSLLIDFQDKSITDIPFDGQITYRVGLEMEYIFPFNKNKWSVFFEPTYQSEYSSEKEVITVFNPVIQNTYTWKISYSSIDLAVGARHYMHINANSRVFINTALVFSAKLNSNLYRNNVINFIDGSSNQNFMFGLGYNYKRISAELRINRSILNSYIATKYSNSSFLLGYTIFKNNKKK